MKITQKTMNVYESFNGKKYSSYHECYDADADFCRDIIRGITHVCGTCWSCSECPFGSDETENATCQITNGQKTPMDWECDDFKNL